MGRAIRKHLQFDGSFSMCHGGTENCWSYSTNDHTAADAIQQSEPDVTLGCRNNAKAKAAEAAIREACPDSKGRLWTVNCDVSSLASVRSFASEIVSSNRIPVDVIVANAGAVISPRAETPEGIEMTFATCVLGHLLLLDLLKPQRMVWVTGDLYCIASATPADPKYPGSGIGAYANACLGRLMLA
eukprot:scaffold236366_cov50-Prasinocladus_malaysianus.AAC.1